MREKGFVITGGPQGFDSTPYATNTAGIYAVGDVRTASVKRVASAVGEGSVVISDVHRYLTLHQDALTPHGYSCDPAQSTKMNPIPNSCR